MLRIFAHMNIMSHVYTREMGSCRAFGRAGIKQINARYDRDHGAGISCMRVSIFAYGRGVEFVVVSKAVFGYDDEKG